MLPATKAMLEELIQEELGQIERLLEGLCLRGRIFFRKFSPRKGEGGKRG